MSGEFLAFWLSHLVEGDLYCPVERRYELVKDSFDPMIDGSPLLASNVNRLRGKPVQRGLEVNEPSATIPNAHVVVILEVWF